ncbi:MAG: hypothetical protein JSU66_10690 [Deltaproteobacteria bacterium]|nr:MAG: hypothetical protein JSU66_10690 [Deltaproteobacteria bacterium]
MLARSIAALLASIPLLGCVGAGSRPDMAYRMAAKVRAPVIPPQGLLYSDIKAPVTAGGTDFGTRRGTATSFQIGLPPLPVAGLASGLDLFAWGDASSEAAAAAGGIQQVDHVDYRLEVFLFVYRRFTTEVYGD